MEEEVDTLRTKAQAYLCQHIFHPNLAISDATSELTDMSQWFKLEPSDIVAECLKYRLNDHVNMGLSSSDAQKFFQTQVDTTSNLIKKQTLLTSTDNIASLNVDDEEWPPNVSNPLSLTDETQESEPEKDPKRHTSLVDIFKIHKALKQGMEITNWDPWQMLETTQYSTEYNNFSLKYGFSEADLTDEEKLKFLQREILLLKNEINFETYLKQQYMQQMGRLHRDRMVESTLESERQTMYNTCRSLQNEVRVLKDTLNRQRAEAGATKSKHVNWENELNSKLRRYRDERKKWNAESVHLNQKIKEVEDINSQQLQQLEGVNSRIFQLENQIMIQDTMVREIQEYEKRIEQLTGQLSLWEEDRHSMKIQAQQIETLIGQWKVLETALMSSESTIKSLNDKASEQERKINELEQSKAVLSTEAEKELLKSKLHDILETQTFKINNELQEKKISLENMLNKNVSLEETILQLKADLELAKEKQHSRNVPHSEQPIQTQQTLPPELEEFMYQTS
ncbi:hypothetical protein K7432_001053 [Basidiobolus ranarum]|uniref:LisH domain-containing protein n=1 Tax=Basidiobolus ranarum TaxID=34480 RepID=A0ABR2WA59_9FUNG